MQGRQGIVDMLTNIYASECKIVKSSRAYLAILPSYMSNIWAEIMSKGMKNLGVVIIVNQIPDDAPEILKISGGRIPFRRTIRAFRRPNGATYLITLPTALQPLWEYLYRKGIKIDIIFFLK